MTRTRVATVLIAIAAIAWTSEARAQEDFRSVEVDRPTRVEDAIPIKLHEWELESGVRGIVGDEGGLLGLVELKTGPVSNVQIGAGLAGGLAASDSDETVSGLEALGLHLLLGLNRETPSWPALAIRLDVSTPGSGSIGHDDWRTGAVGLATRSWGRIRTHGNVGYTRADNVDDYWRVGAALDYPIGLFSRSIVGAVFAEIPTGSEEVRVWGELGSRWQLSNETVLDLGLATRLDGFENGEPNVEIVAGFSRIFGVPWLTPTPRYPDPPLD